MNISSIEGIEYFSNLKNLYFENNPIISIDASSLTNIITMGFDNMPSLTTIFIKNGIDNSLVDPETEEGGFYSFNCPNLEYICADDFEVIGIQEVVSAYSGSNAIVNSYCASDIVGDVAYIINGKHNLDSDLNGCDANDSYIPHLKYTISNGIDNAIVVTDSYGNFSFPIHQDGMHTITPIMPEPNNPDYYIASPANTTFNFPTDSSPTDIEFCFAINQNATIYIPDSGFKNILTNTNCVDTDGNGLGDANVDLNNDGEIQVSEAEAVTKLKVTTAGIYNVIGLEKFVNLEYLYCGITDPWIYSSPSYVFEIDVSQMPNLKTFEIPNNRIDNLELSQNLNLEKLDCSENGLTTLNLNNNINLTYLDCSNFPVYYTYGSYDQNSFTLLDLSNNSNLTYFDCTNSLSFLGGNINFGSITGIATLKCSENNLESLNVSQFSNLSELYCYNSNLSTLDVSQNLNLTKLYCFNDPYYTGIDDPYDHNLDNDNTITSLDVSQNTQLTNLRCYRNNMETLIIGSNPNLYFLSCEYNQIDNLDVSNCTGLYSLWCFNNQITTLNLTNTPELSGLYCSFNQLTELDVSQNPVLNGLEFSNNQISVLDTSQNPELHNLDCTSNQLTELYLNQNPELGRLYALNNPLTHIYVKNGSEFITEAFEGTDYYRFNINTNNLEYICADDFEIADIVNKYPTISSIVDSSCSNTLSLEETEKSNLNIHPNPVQDKLFIEGIITIKSVTIYDISGRLINQVSYLGNHNNIEISTEKLSEGTYFVKVKTDVGEFVKKVVKE